MDDAAHSEDTPLDRAKAGVGGNTGLSRLLSGTITPQAISQWKKVPAERVLDVERATGVSRHELRPDIYPAPDMERAAS